MIDISKFSECRILVIGDLMIDEYMWGEVDRISPEAPVPIVSIKSENFTLGGAGNVINNIASLGGMVSAIGIIGKDRHGDILLDFMNNLGVDAKGIIQDSKRPTTLKTRIIARSQHLLRIDRETKSPVSEETCLDIIKFLESEIASVDLIIVSDYGKGVLTNSVLKNTANFAKKYNKIAIADPKGLDFTKYSGFTVLKPNKAEACIAAGIEFQDENSILKASEKILNSVDIKNLLVTCGKDGMILFRKNLPPFKIASEAKQIFDVSGAGDTVVAALGLSLAAKASYEDSIKIANTAAGIVVGKIGTATVSVEELSLALKK